MLGEIPEGREFMIPKLRSTPIIAFAPAGSEIAKLKSIRLPDLARLPLVLREPGLKTRAKLEEYTREKGGGLDAHIEAEGREAVREIVAFGRDANIVSEAKFGQDARLAKIPIDDSKLVMDEALIALKERQDNKLIRAFISLV